jgi:hypothetical protein
MICVNELSTQKMPLESDSRAFGDSDFALCTHTVEELWSILGHEGSIALVPSSFRS